MSVVTNVILTFSIGEYEYTKGDSYRHYCVDEINKWLLENDTRAYRIGLKNVWQYAGGDKNLETDIYTAAFNHLDIEAFKQCVFSQDWMEPESVQLYIKGQEDDVFTEYRSEA
jgi:hypothetical protein